MFIDFENIAITSENTYGKCELELIVNAAERWGRCVIKRAYGDWTRFARYKQDLIMHSIELVQLFHYGAAQSKNAADIQMVVDALETALTRPGVSVFVLATGDSDFSAVARKLRAYGKLVVGIGLRQATSEVLVKACDEFHLYDTLKASKDAAVSYPLERGRRLLVGAMNRLEARFGADGVPAAALKYAMLSQDRTFDEVTLGFGQFRAFLEAQRDLVHVIPREGTDVAVVLASEEIAQPQEDEMAPYEKVLDVAGLYVRDPQARTQILEDLYDLLRQHPGEYKLEDAISQLKAQYDTGNVFHSLDQVRDTAKLLRYADVLDPKPQSWELDCLMLEEELTAQEMVDRCEAVYLSVLLDGNLDFDPDLVSRVLFGTANESARVRELGQLLENGGRRPDPSLPSTSQDVLPLRQIPELEVVFRDLGDCALDEEATADRARELETRGHETRRQDFGLASGFFLRAAKMTCSLLERGEPGGSLTELKRRIAGYCASAAGRNFSLRNYAQAADYYSAFFSLARETDPVWDHIDGLVDPMLSYYLTIAAAQHLIRLPVDVGRTRPWRIAALLHQHADAAVRARWMELADDLVQTNPTIVRTLVRQLDEAAAQGAFSGAAETRDYLRSLLE
jgi:hypothetical protein